MQRYHIDNLELTPVNMQHGQYKFMSNNQQLLDKLDEAYTRLYTNDKIQPLQDKWFYPERQDMEESKGLWYLLGGGLLLLVFMAVYGISYHIQNRKIKLENVKRNNRLALILQTSQVHIWTYDIKTNRFSWHNDNGQVAYTYSMEEFSQRYSHEDFVSLKSALEKLAETRKTDEEEKEIELNLRAKDTEGGDTNDRDYHIVLSVLSRDKKGNPTVIIGTKKDVTEEQQQKRLDEERALRYWSIFYTPILCITLFNKAGRLVNIHPSLLPAFPGLHTHRRAIEAGCRVAGATVHRVTEELDHGPTVRQGNGGKEAFRGKDLDRRAAKVLAAEAQDLRTVFIPDAQGVTEETGTRLRPDGLDRGFGQGQGFQPVGDLDVDPVRHGGEKFFRREPEAGRKLPLALHAAHRGGAGHDHLSAACEIPVERALFRFGQARHARKQENGVFRRILRHGKDGVGADPLPEEGAESVGVVARVARGRSAVERAVAGLVGEEHGDGTEGIAPEQFRVRRLEAERLADEVLFVRERIEDVPREPQPRFQRAEPRIRAEKLGARPCDIGGADVMAISGAEGANALFAGARLVVRGVDQAVRHRHVDGTGIVRIGRDIADHFHIHVIGPAQEGARVGSRRQSPRRGGGGAAAGQHKILRQDGAQGFVEIAAGVEPQVEPVAPSGIFPVAPERRVVGGGRSIPALRRSSARQCGQAQALYCI